MTPVKNLVNNLSKEYLYRLRGDKAVIAKESVLTLTFPVAQDVGREAKPRAHGLRRVYRNKIGWEDLLSCQNLSLLAKLQGVQLAPSPHLGWP